MADQTSPQPPLSALIVVDMQNDFLEGGTLPVAFGSSLVPLINKIRCYVDQVVFTQDWHPSSHISFAINHEHAQPFTQLLRSNGEMQTLWPVHCIEGTSGAALHRDLLVSSSDWLHHKGTDERAESYSAFFDDRKQSTGLVDRLRESGITRVYVCGVALDFCVRATALDAAQCGFETVLLRDATKPLDENAAIVAEQEMRDAGIRITTSEQEFVDRV